MWLIAGLGNPGASYAQQRHNAGFMVIDALARAYDAPPMKSAHHALCSKVTIADMPCMLVKPQTFMNLSGQAMLGIATFYKIAPEKILVIHDDLDLKLGQLRMKIGGGHGGHNGLRDMDARMGKDYWRLRIGIGHPRDSNTPQMEVSDFVLQNFSADEQRVIDNVTDEIARHMALFFTHSPVGFMSKLAERLRAD